MVTKNPSGSCLKDFSLKSDRFSMQLKEELQGGRISRRKRYMRKIEDIEFDRKREKIINTLVNNGIFKVEGKQLYELPLFELMKQYTKNNLMK